MGLDHHHAPDRPRGPLWRWWAVAAATVAALASGAYGVYQYELERTGEGHVSNALYHAVQMFALHGPEFEPPLNLWLELGRWGAVALVSLAAAGAALHVFAAHALSFRLARLRRHAVVCGGGRLALDLVRALRTRRPRQPIVLLSPSEDADVDAAARGLGALALTGAPGALLERARVARAARLIAVGEEDAANVDTAVRAGVLTRERRPAGLAPLECHAQVGDIDLRETLRHQNLPAEQSRCRIHFFDFSDDVARDLLLERLPLDHDGLDRQDPREVHLVVVGFGGIGRAVTVRAAQLGHFANGRPLRISVIDREAAAREADLLFRYPAIRETCHLTFHDCAVQSPEARALLEHWCRDRGAVTSVAVCLDGDAVALDLAIRLLPGLQATGVPVALRLSRPDGLTMLVREGAASREGLRQLRAFGWFEEAAFGRLLADDPRETMAKLVHGNFVTLAESHGREAALDQAVRGWDALVHEDYKESSRQQVDHMGIKLRAIGCERAHVSDPRPKTEFTAAEVELLAEMEHARWVAERWLAGWTYAPGKKDEQRRTNPNMRPWADIADSIREYDREAVRAMPAVVAEALGQKICRRGPARAEG